MDPRAWKAGPAVLPSWRETCSLCQLVNQKTLTPFASEIALDAHGASVTQLAREGQARLLVERFLVERLPHGCPA